MLSSNLHVTLWHTVLEIFAVKLPKFRPKKSDLLIPGAPPQKGRRQVGTHIHYHAKFHADRCHRRRYIFNRGEKKPANLVPCHTNVTYLWLVISKLQLKFGLKWLFERAWLMEGAYENLWKSGRFCLLIAWWIDSCCATLYNKHLLWLGGCHVRVLCRNS